MADSLPIILDGGMSRELIRLGAPFAQPEWSALALIEAPHYVRQVHDEFIAAGADVITTNSYALVPFHIGEERFWSHGAELARLSGKLAREAADAEFERSGRRIRVAGSLPPIFGSYEPEKFVEAKVGKYLDLLVGALEGYVDFWLGETFSVIAEAKAAIEAVRKGGKGKKVWIAFCPNDGESGKLDAPALRSGEKIEEVVRWALNETKKSRMEALLFNCCRPDFMDAALDTAVQAIAEAKRSEQIQTPMLGVYANLFLPRPDDYAANEHIGGTDARFTPELYSNMAANWRGKGADIVGGCCGIGHAHIRAVSERLKQNA